MPPRKATKVAEDASDRFVPASARPRLRKLTIRNFCCIGPDAVEIELDDIVVLVGPNNSGKSSILRAYEIAMSEGSAKGKLELADFPSKKINPDALPEIELETSLYTEERTGQHWIITDPVTQDRYVRERWKWFTEGDPKRQGFDPIVGDWVDEVPWGAPNVAKQKRPEPHRIDAFASPDKQASEIISLLNSVLVQRIKEHQQGNGSEAGEKNGYGLLLEQLGELQRRVVEETFEQVTEVETEVSKLLQEVFPGYSVKFDARPEDDLEKAISLFKANPQLLMGRGDEFMAEVARQGSGARRTLLWTAIRYLKEHARKATGKDPARPHVLLLDEPEICLHPSAIRDASRVLYELPSAGTWQVMLTTHSPIFIDISRDNTTIVRVERTNGAVTGTTLFRPNRVDLDDDDKVLLKLLNLCDPYVNEFFFGGRTVIVEGDTEYTAFKFVMERFPDEFRDVHIVRARGKSTIVSLMKILNQFGATYGILHDSDRPVRVDGVSKNSAWVANERIQSLAKIAPNGVRVVASVPNFEAAFFGAEVKEDKPYNALLQLTTNEAFVHTIRAVLHALIDDEAPTPRGAIRWNVISELTAALGERRDTTPLLAVVVEAPNDDMPYPARTQAELP